MATERIAREVQDVQIETKKKLEETNIKYKAVADKHRVSRSLKKAI